MNFPRPPAPGFLRSKLRLILLILALAAVGAALCAFLVPRESLAVRQHLLGFPDADAQAESLRPWILGALCLLPTLAAFAYACGGTLDRYITRRFLVIFAICITALFTIWLLIDLADHLADFRRTPDPLATMLLYYGTRFPAIVLLLLPYSLLLSLLESLGKLSTNREIIAMIQSGRGVLRITLPLIAAGLFCTLLTLGMNYHWAPVAEGRQAEILAETAGTEATVAANVLYRNGSHRRLWMIGSFPRDYEKGRPLNAVEVTTTNDQQLIETRLTASHATWDRHSRVWSFENALLSRFTPDSPPVFEKTDTPLTITGWPESPQQLIKPGLSAENLGIPDLNAWLLANRLHPQSLDPSPYLTHWHYRFALPFTCLVTVLLATPLAIHFSRRGPGGGVLLAVVLSALMLLVNTIVLAFGEAGTLKPPLAAWLPNAAFALLGFYLYHRRITGRPIYHSLRKILPNGD
jgi:lipopolysaccharide export system permease protein